jgi:hypothetical protein
MFDGFADSAVLCLLGVLIGFIYARLRARC